MFRSTKDPDYTSESSVHPIGGWDWLDLDHRLTRAGTATITLGWFINASLDTQDEERFLSLLGRCHNLGILLDVEGFTFPSSISMPHLEHLTLDDDGKANIEPLLDAVERRSPLLRTLTTGYFPATSLARRNSLLRRIVHLNLMGTIDDDISLQGFQNLEKLVIYSLGVKTIRILPSDLPKLVSIYIGDIVLPTSQRLLTFPALESLTLSGRWSNLRFIAARKLRNLVLTNRDEEQPEKITMLALRRSTVRPISLSTDFISDTSLTELLGLWSTLSELHLRGRNNDCILGSTTTAALAGSHRGVPLCSSLRYLTVHMEQGWQDPMIVNQSVQRLQTIVEERKSHGECCLQRVMCIWCCEDPSTEVEWVDIL